MSPTPVPTRITIDFRDAIHPSRMWILGVDGTPDARVDLLALGAPLASGVGSRAVPVATVRPTALIVECACPEFCERDHANE